MAKSKDEVVRKSNVFVEGRYRFGLHEQKILLMIVSQVRTDQKAFTPYRVSWDEIKRVSKGKLNTVAKIDRACENLKNKTISIKKGREIDNFGFLSGWKTYQGKYVEFRLDPAMKDMLLGLLEEGNFTLYKLECALALPSAHAVRMYEILQSHLYKKQPVIILLDDLKKSLDIPLKSKTYTNFSNFRQFILDRVKKNLLKYTDISFTYKTIKDGRKVGSISFRIKENKKFQRTIQAAVARETLKPGDTILMGGKEYEINSSGGYYRKGVVPIGELNKMRVEGKIQLLEE
jgi:plasmid replication initiation protein